MILSYQNLNLHLVSCVFSHPVNKNTQDELIVTLKENIDI